MLKKNAFAAFAVAAAAGVILMPAHAYGTYAPRDHRPIWNFQTVQDLYSTCTAENEPTSKFICVSYISGVADMMATIGGGDSKKNKAVYGSSGLGIVKSFGICFKNFVSHGAEVQVFKNWAEKNPKLWSRPMVLGVMLSLRATWPCT